MAIGQYEIVGTRFKRLIVLAVKHVAFGERKRWIASVRCDCGIEKTVAADDLIQRKTQSCGCLRLDRAKERIVPIEKRFWKKVNKNGPIPDYCPDLGRCWLWTASINAKGYGTLGSKNGSTLAHRISMELNGWVVKSGMQIDHLCRVRSCVNPKHLEVVTPKINCHRGYGPTALHARKTHCPQGHPYSDENTYLYIGGVHKGNRQCRICGRRRSREYLARKKLK